MKTRIKLEGEELEHYWEIQKEKEKDKKLTEAATKRYCRIKLQQNLNVLNGKTMTRWFGNWLNHSPFTSKVAV